MQARYSLVSNKIIALNRTEETTRSNIPLRCQFVSQDHMSDDPFDILVTVFVFIFLV